MNVIYVMIITVSKAMFQLKAVRISETQVTPHAPTES
jgi:hypothetical protein